MLLGMPVELQGFRLSSANPLQCQVRREKQQRWVGIEDLDEEGLPADYHRLLKLYNAWLNGDY